MKNISNIKSIQKKCELMVRKSEVIQEFDLMGTYGDVSQQSIDNYDKEYVKGLFELRSKLNSYLSDY